MKKQDDIQTEEKVEEEKNEAQEWKDKYLRALADYKNLERRTYEEKQEIRTFAAEIILLKLLPVVDSFQKAKEHIKDPGLDLAFKQLTTLLDELGVAKLDVAGKEFNPHEMECIEVVEGKENMVMEEILPGYTFRDKILRVAQVKVGKKLEARSTKFETNSNDQNLKN